MRPAVVPILCATTLWWGLIVAHQPLTALPQAHFDSRDALLHDIRLRFDAMGSSMPLHLRSPVLAGSDSTFGRFLSGSSKPFTLAHRSCEDAAAVSQEGHIISVVDFGADPNGLTVSDAAFEAAVQKLLSFAVPGRHMAQNISDLGGATLDLSGGSFLISRPIAIPAWVGNFRIQRGSLYAASNFTQNRFLIEVGMDSATCKKANNQKSCNENVGLTDLLLDGSRAHVAGCVQINSTMGGNIGPDIYFLGFERAGAEINGGHEIMIHESWVGHRYYSDPGKLTNYTTVGIDLNGNDHVLSDIIVFSAQTGVRCGGGANIVTGVHTWNQATAKGGLGIVVKEATATRLDLVYLDYNSLLLEDPEETTVTNSFFLGMGNIVLKAGTAGTVSGLSLIANTFNNWNMPHNDTVVLDERNGTFTQVHDMVMVGNLGTASMRSVSVHASRTTQFQHATRFQLDFSSDLLFPNVPIVESTYSVAIAGKGQFTRHAMRNFVVGGGGNSTPGAAHVGVVELEEAVNASVYMKVSQSISTPGNEM